MFSSFNCYSCCRLCLQYIENISFDCLVFKELNAAIKNVFSFEISINDKCSTKICRECSKKVSSISMYKDTVVNNQKTIQQYQDLQSKLFTYQDEIKTEGSDDSDDIVFVSEIERPNQNNAANNIPLHKDIQTKDATEEKVESIAQKDSSKSNVDCSSERRSSSPEVITSVPSLPAEIISLPPTPLPKLQKRNKTVFKRLRVICKIITEEDVKHVFLTKKDRKILNVYGKRKGKNTREDPNSSSIGKFRTEKSNLIQRVSQNNCVVTKNPPIRLSLNKLKKKIDASFKKGRRRSISAESTSSSTISVSSTTTNVVNLVDDVDVQMPSTKSNAARADPHLSNLIDKTIRNNFLDLELNIKVPNTTSAAVLTNISSQPTRKQNSIVSSNANKMPVIIYNHGPQTSNMKHVSTNAYPINKNSNTGLPCSISIANTTISKASKTMPNSNAIKSALNSHLTAYQHSSASSFESQRSDLNRAKSAVNPTLFSLSKDLTVKAIMSKPNSTISISYPALTNSIRQEANRKMPSANSTISAMSNSNPAITNPNFNLYSTMSNQNLSTLNLTSTTTSSNQIRMTANPIVSISTVSNTNTKLTNVYPTKLCQNPAFRLQQNQISQTRNINERNEQNRSVQTINIERLTEVSKDTSQPKNTIALEEYIPMEQFFVRQISTSNPNRGSDPKVKVLSVNELNLRADVASYKDGDDQKLPIRITLVRVKNELQIKLTDSKNNDITFKNLSVLEQQAVRTSLLQPTSKAQIMAAIKACGLDQYSRNLLNFLGLSSLIPNNNYHQD